MRALVVVLVLTLGACTTSDGRSVPLSNVSAGYRTGGVLGMIGAMRGEEPPPHMVVVQQPAPPPPPQIIQPPPIQWIQPPQPPSMGFTCIRSGPMVSCD